MLPEEIHLRGMTTFSVPKMYCGNYDNTYSKNEVYSLTKNIHTFFLIN